eukprot:5880110-Prymnesium_polylepis.1
MQWPVVVAYDCARLDEPVMQQPMVAIEIDEKGGLKVVPGSQRWCEAVAVVPLYECRAAIPRRSYAVTQELKKMVRISQFQRLGGRVAPSRPVVARTIFACLDRREAEERIKAPQLAIFHSQLVCNPNHPTPSVHAKL